MGDVKGFPVRLSFEDVREFTDDFSDQNFITDFQFGKVYHGKINLPGCADPKPVTVKIWEVPTKYMYYEDDNVNRFMDEVVFLTQNEISHPMLMKLYGYCSESDSCCVVYDFKSFNTVLNLILDDDFTWLERMKFALKFAHFLRYLHGQNDRKRPLLIRNIDAAHIMVDEDCNPKLYDFSMITGDMFPDRTILPEQHLNGAHGYEELGHGEWSVKSDVYAFGIILLCLTTKEVFTEEERLTFETPDIIERSDLKYKEGGASLETSIVHKSFETYELFYPSDGPTITQLGLNCVEPWPRDRPQMEDVVNTLERLEIVKRHLTPIY